MTEWFGAPAGYEPSHDQVGLLQEGRLIAMGKNYLHVTPATCEVLNVRVPDLRMIEYVLDVQFTVIPLDCSKPIYEAANKKITGNVVGMTIFTYAQTAGTTIIAEVIAIGTP
jgi:hypothetical protein